MRNIVRMIVMVWTVACGAGYACANPQASVDVIGRIVEAPGDTLYVTAPEGDVDMVKGDSIVLVRRVPRVITPVDIDDNKPPVVMHYYDKHGNALEEPVMFLATLDTVTKPKSRPVYPLYSGVSLGVSFADAVMMACGQRYGSYGIWADVSLWNWLFPVAEFGVGFADSHPEKSNFKYRGKPAPYAKLGFNYNFVYKSDPAYQMYVGFRAGYTSFKYDVDDVSISSDYWGETQHFNITGQRAHAVYGEALAGIKVNIVKNFSLGWNVAYHFKFKVWNRGASQPWFIPGYGATSPIAFNFSAIWNLPGAAKKKDANLVNQASDTK